MKQTLSIGSRPELRGPIRRDVAAPWALTALVIVCLGAPCMAADSMSGLGSTFKPQGLPETPVAASGDRTAGGPAGLRVVVVSASRSVASIDGQVVRTGDLVNGKRVTRIDSHGVVLTEESGSTERLTITPAVVRRKTAVAASSPSAGAHK